MSAVIHLPTDPARLRAGIAAVRARAAKRHARRALATLWRELQDGRSTAAAVALATSTFRRPMQLMQGGAP